MPLGLGSSESIGDIIGRSEESANRAAFSRDFGVTNFDEWGGTLQSGKFIEIGRFRAPADTEYSFGYGRAANPSNQGYIYFDPVASGEGTGADGDEIEGTLRLVVESSTGRSQHVVADLDTAKLDSSKSNREKMVPLPEQVGSPLATQDAYLVLKLDPRGSDDGKHVADDTEMIMPVTEYDLS